MTSAFEERCIRHALLGVAKEYSAYMGELGLVAEQLTGVATGLFAFSSPKRWTVLANLLLRMIEVEKTLGEIFPVKIVLPFLKIPSNFNLFADNLAKVLDILKGFPGAWSHSQLFAVSVAFFRDGDLSGVSPATVLDWFCGHMGPLDDDARLSARHVTKMCDAFGDAETFEVVRKVLQKKPAVLSTGVFDNRLDSWKHVESVLDLLCGILSTFPRLTEVIDLPPPISDRWRHDKITYTLYDKFLEAWRAACRKMDRIKTIGVMKGAWQQFRGNPPAKDLPNSPAKDSPAKDSPAKDSPAKDSPAKALARALSLRRFCRIRGKDSEDMPNEVVEPFARDIVRFL